MIDNNIYDSVLVATASQQLQTIQCYQYLVSEGRVLAWEMDKENPKSLKNLFYNNVSISEKNWSFANKPRKEYFVIPTISYIRNWKQTQRLVFQNIKMFAL